MNNDIEQYRRQRRMTDLAINSASNLPHFEPSFIARSINPSSYAAFQLLDKTAESDIQSQISSLSQKDHSSKYHSSILVQASIESS